MFEAWMVTATITLGTGALIFGVACWLERRLP